MTKKYDRGNKQRWTHDKPRVGSVRRGAAPLTPAYVPARRKETSK